MNEPQSLELSSDDVASFLKVIGWFEVNEPQSLELSSDDVASFLKVMGWFEEQKGQCFPGETMLTPQQMAEALRVIGVVFAELKQGPPPKPKRKIR